MFKYTMFFFIGNLRFSLASPVIVAKELPCALAWVLVFSHVFCEVVVLSTVLCFGMA